MKRYVMTLLLTLGFAMGAQALDYETAREQAYYLTDKMAYYHSRLSSHHRPNQ